MAVINVLLVGGRGSFFFGAIVDHLLKERCDVFHIAGKTYGAMNTARNGVVTYNIDLDDEYVRVVVQSVKPDTIIFLGAYDDGHSWQDYHRASAKYISALTNILVSASDLGVKKFIYLSTINVYGFKNFGVVTEDFPAAPSNVKSIIVSQGERLCMEFTQNGKIDATILRFGQIYGDIKSQNLQLDYVIKKCLDALTDGKLIANNQSFPLIHMNDAVIAVYKSSYLDAPSGIYNVCDDATVTDEEICGIISECYADLNIPIERDQRFVAQDYSISGEKFNKSYSFFQKVKFKEGIAAVAAYVRENQAKLSQLKDKAGDTEEEKGRRWAALRYLGKKAIPYLESLIVFALFWGIDYLFNNVLYVTGIDFMLLFVILMSVTFGKSQSLIAALLAIGYYFGVNMGAGMGWLQIVVSSAFIMRILLVLTGGLIVGHVRDRLHEKPGRAQIQNEILQEEYTKLDEINNVTMTIKQELESRMITNTDSLATIYTLVEEIEGATSEDVYMNSLQPLCRILKTESVCIYVKNPDNALFTLHGWTDDKAMELGKEINLFYLPEMNERFLSHNVYTNAELHPGRPQLAGPLGMNGEIKAIVMVWDLGFHTTTMYHLNLFLTLTKIITHALEHTVRTEGIMETRAREALYTAACMLRINDGAGVAQEIVAKLRSSFDAANALNRSDDSCLDILLPGVAPETLVSFLNDPLNHNDPLFEDAEIFTLIGRTREE